MTEIEIVDLFLNDKGFREIVEDELGNPIKVTVYWASRTVLVQGPLMGRELSIDDILKAYAGTLTQ